MKKLIVSEVFYSLQCEGRSIGTPAVFLRLAGCNLLCKSKDWVCDSIEVWQKGIPTDFDKVLSQEMIGHLAMGAHLVITGGEPLKQQMVLEQYLDWLTIELGGSPFIEVETNGTITPSSKMLCYVKWWNSSPKLRNSGESVTKRINELAIFALNKENTIFKFVVNCEDDLLEIFQDYPEISPSKIWLMPAGATREELEVNRLVVVELAKKYHFNYSDRLHIVIWNKKTGV